MAAHQYILSIAGFDPSSGAGITSDIKTFEAHGLYGLSVCTAITVQNDVEFKACIWTDVKVIIAQIETLFNRFDIPVVKIGIVESWAVLSQIINTLKALNPHVKIIVDPVFKASAGFYFHTKEHQERLDSIWKQCYVITPNYDEIKSLYPELSVEATLERLSQHTNVYLKGGHRADKKGWDQLYHSAIVMVNLQPNVDKVYEKHGSGCVLASALASNIALGYLLEDAARLAKSYTEAFLNSSETLLGIHHHIKKTQHITE
ncbi:hydroxymethylpyrimidine/phosphomethylpyrimidine kinase [Tamlana fucoidanivorans]|uniref:hydroxymethylpyrimidine kinase n=1 Tax=Allotamlana fucoidanivorans TaxID=2583814 RepID=A0A5C4SRN5_9FLAO|nr:hydroxymethylpyrimidine/phosphomethylpyrimidine kinase [Tamlana fucoidanivorans]TNJ47094.1 hydroxymethylpyrimidine/phosphomethylpyrimidine kinase [Tamlana fucoidanivorans]